MRCGFSPGKSATQKCACGTSVWRQREPHHRRLHDDRRHLRAQEHRKEELMGSLYRPTYRAADGTRRESAVIWAKYRDALGVLVRESTGADKEQEARRFLKQREGAAVEGRVIVPRADKIAVLE